MVPLLSKAPLAQNEFERTCSGLTVLSARFQSAPHVEWLLIWSGSFDARSKNRTRFGETTIDSRATMPEFTFLRSNFQPGAEGAARDEETRSRKR